MGRPYRIDTHQHIVPPGYARWMLEKGIRPGGVGLPSWSERSALKFMDRHDVQTGILSLSTPGVYFGDAAEARRRAREINEYSAEVVAARPERFGFFATLTLPDVQGALAEAQYALDTLLADGIVLLANNAGQSSPSRASSSQCVMVSPKGLKLVDYDGVFVPGMPADFSSETGHKHFQHPRRALSHFGPAIDRFSFIAVDLSLAALIEDPSLHRRFRHGGETILFRANDFADPDGSEVFGFLRRLGKLRPAAENFAAICRADVAAVPSLADFRACRAIPSGTAAAASAPTTARPRASRYIGPSPVMRAEDFAAVAGCVGQRIELVGQVRGVKRGIGEHGDRRGKPCVLVDFGPPRGDGVRVSVWAENQAQLRDAPDESWVGRWVSIVGLVEPPHTERSFWRARTRVGIGTENPREIDPISEDEARFRLRRGNAPAASRAAARPAAAMAAGANRRLVANLLDGNPNRGMPAPPRLAPATPAVRAAPSQRPAGRSNQAILQALRPPAAAVSPPKPVVAAPVRQQPLRPAMAKAGSVVIHPRNRATPRSRSAARPPEEPTPWQRVLRLFGGGT